MTAPEKPRERRSWIALLKRFSVRLIVVSAYAYPVTLLALCLALSLVGEDWWVTAGLLYAPRILFGAPGVVLVPALLLAGRKKLLWTQAAALLLTLVPLMGLVLPWPASSAGQAPSLRLLSFNVDSGHAGSDRVIAAVDAEKPDIVLFQESPWGGPLHNELRARFPHFDHSTEFVLASRFPILEQTAPPKVAHFGRERSPRFKRYLLDTNLGKLAVYSIHPISPRGALGISRFRGALRTVRSGEIWDTDPETDLGRNASLRAKQVAAVAELASKEPHPVLIAGDTNLPGLSAVLRRHLRRYHDAFEEAGWGFGYTYPRRRPFLRLDRILGGPELRFTEFRVGCPGVSDHLCVIARVIRR